MQLSNKKELAAKVLEVGKGRIIFVESALAEIKEAITRQDILDLHKNLLHSGFYQSWQHFRKRKNHLQVLSLWDYLGD